MIYQMISGPWVDLDNLTVAEIVLTDVPHVLSNICRFNGHVRHHYSVAQHCVYVHDAVAKDHGPGDIAFAALMHDAGEMYLGDDITPKKQRFPDLRKLHDKLQEKVYLKCGLLDISDFLEVIVDYDTRALHTEAAYFGNDLSHPRWASVVKHPQLNHPITPWSPSLAETEFAVRMDAHLRRKNRGCY